MQELEIIINDKNMTAAETTLLRFGFSKKDTSAHYQIEEKLFIFRLSIATAIGDTVYVRIRDSQKLSIVSDSASAKRSIEILESIYKIEMLLRRTLLYISRSVKAYNERISAAALSSGNKQANSIIPANSLDPITSSLTLSEIIDLLTKQTWAPDLSSATLLDLLNEVEDFSSFRAKIKAHLEPPTIWDTISNTLLEKEVKWKEVGERLDKLKKYRNTAAHFKTITEDEKKSCVQTVDELLELIKINDNPTPGELETLQRLDAEGATAISTPGPNGGYPTVWADVPIDSIVDTWGFYNRESVSYVAWKIASSGRNVPYGLGNANLWPTGARAQGIAVDSKPRVGDAAILEAGYYGHAMYIEAVHDDDTVTISQYNADWNGSYSTNRLSTRGLTFVHF
jgi:surface antigen